MHRRHTLAVLILVSGLAGAGLARAQPDPLWEKTLAQVAQTKKWAPGEVMLTVDGVGEGKTERTRTRQRLSGWEGSNPVYESVQIEPPPASGKQPGKSQFDMTGIGEATDELLRIDTKVRRTDNQALHGRSWTLFEAAQSKGPMDVTVKIWVDPLTGTPHRMESTVHGTLMMDMVLRTDYRPHRQAGSLPERFDFRMKVLVPFTDARVNIVSEMDKWQLRPLDAGAKPSAAAAVKP